MRADKFDVPEVGVSFDEMKIRPGLTHIPELAMLGCVDGAIAENNIESVDCNTMLQSLAVRVMMVHITTLDGKASVLLLHFPTTNSTTAELVFQKVNISA